MPEIEVGGQRLHYREAGEGRPPLLLVHGAGGSSQHFAALLGKLGRPRRVIALDLPGHGRSAPFQPGVPESELLERYRDLCADSSASVWDWAATWWSATRWAARLACFWRPPTRTASSA